MNQSINQLVNQPISHFIKENRYCQSWPDSRSKIVYLYVVTMKSRYSVQNAGFTELGKTESSL